MQLPSDNESATLVISCLIHKTLYKMVSDLVKAQKDYIHHCSSINNLSLTENQEHDHSNICDDNFMIFTKPLIDYQEGQANKQFHNMSTITEIHIKMKEESLLILGEIRQTKNIYA